MLHGKRKLCEDRPYYFQEADIKRTRNIANAQSWLHTGRNFANNYSYKNVMMKANYYGLGCVEKKLIIYAFEHAAIMLKSEYIKSELSLLLHI